jgi:hypothetical protein
MRLLRGLLCWDWGGPEEARAAVGGVDVFMQLGDGQAGRRWLGRAMAGAFGVEVETPAEGEGWPVTTE